ncbi:MAG: peptide chain release factor 1 [Acetobacteraceae bacterium]|nr:peptide chain release factor 1 [Acetobacteraceae bacterium]
MWDKLEAVESTYEQLAAKIADPAVLASRSEWQRYAREHARLGPVVEKYREYKKTQKELEETRGMLRDGELDAEMRALVEGEVRELSERRERLEAELKLLLMPRDPLDEKNVIVEVRGGTGGEEAALFAAALFRMYTRFAERRGWKVEVLDTHPTDMGGIKEVVFAVEGRGAYSQLKYESGVHRVQRVPVTEAGGRIHTSTATVAVLPEAEEVDVEINPDDLVIDTFCSSGPGGQHVNKTASAVRITHLPTGLVVSCQDEKSQHKNRDKAMRVLRSRLLKMAEEAQHQELAEMRRSQVGTGERSERIRTYNYPQNRVTDHRLGLTVHRLAEVLDGELSVFIEAMATSEEARKLRQVE